MAGNTITISVLANTGGAAKNVDSLAAKFDRIGSRFSKAGNIAGVAGAAIVGGIAAAIKPASDLQQNVGGVQAVFGKYANSVIKDSKRAASAVGLSQNQYDQFATVIGSQFKNAGIPIDQLGKKTKGLIGQASDLAATFGGSTSDAVDALSAAMKGEFDPIEKYGISLSQAQLNAQGLADGIKGNSSTWDNATKQQEILRAVTKQSGDAQGQFAKQSNTLAEQQQIVQAKLANTVAKLGTAFLPMVSKVADAVLKLVDGPGFKGLINFLSTNPKLVLAVVGGLLGLAGVLKVTGAAMQSVGTGVKVFKTVSTGVTATAGAIGRFRDGFTNASAAASAFSGKAGSIGGAAKKALSGVQSLGRGAASLATSVGTGTAALAKQAAAWTLNTARMVAAKTAQLAVSAATKVAAGVQAAFNVVLSLNPIGLLVLAIAALVAGLVWFFTQTKLGQAIVATAFAGIQTVIGAVVSWFTDTALPAITGTWTAVTGAFKAGSAKVGAFLNGALGVIKTVWSYTPLGLITGNWSKIMAFFAAVPGRVGAYFGSAVSWLKSAGTNVITGLYNGVTGTWSKVSSWLGGIPSRAGSAVGSLAGVLKSAGQSLLNGLINGITSKWNDVRNLLTSLTNKLPSWKGPASKDSKLLTGAGQLIMKSLVKGLQAGTSNVKSTLNGVTNLIQDGLTTTAPAIPAFGAAAFTETGDLPGGNTYVIQLSTLNPTPEVGRLVVDAINDYNRVNGSRA